MSLSQLDLYLCGRLCRLEVNSFAVSVDNVVVQFTSLYSYFNMRLTFSLYERPIYVVDGVLMIASLRYTQLDLP